MVQNDEKKVLKTRTAVAVMMVMVTTPLIAEPPAPAALSGPDVNWAQY